MTDYEIHFPTEQYGFILKKVEGDDADAVEAYRSLSKSWNGGDGLPDKEFNEIFDRYCWMDEGFDTEKHDAMSREQKDLIQAIKRSQKRQLYKGLQEEQDVINHIKSINEE